MSLKIQLRNLLSQYQFNPRVVSVLEFLPLRRESLEYKTKLTTLPATKENVDLADNRSRVIPGRSWNSAEDYLNNKPPQSIGEFDRSFLCHQLVEIKAPPLAIIYVNGIEIYPCGKRPTFYHFTSE